MKNILKIGLGILMLGIGVNSCNKSQAKDHHHESGRCIGAKNCRACKTCEYCRHCNSGGRCGVCSRKKWMSNN